MILVVGACASGKRTYAKSCGFSESDLCDAKALMEGLCDGMQNTAGSTCNEALPEAFLRSLAADERSVVFNLQAVAAHAPLEQLADALKDKAMVLCNEVGAGVVPIDAVQRASREATGRLTVRLAAQAEGVVRMVCGIPQVLKGDNNLHSVKSELSASSDCTAREA